MKKNIKKIKKFEFRSKRKIKTFEKKPQKGGTPAIENNETTSNFVNVPVEPKSLKEYNVLTRLLVNWKRVVKITKRAKLYMNR